MAKIPRMGKEIRDEFPLIEPGIYLVSVFESQDGSSEEGNPYIRWTFKIQEGEYKGLNLFDNTSLLPQSLWKLKQLVKFCGLDPEEEHEPSDLYGKLLKVQVYHDEYLGMPRAKVKRYLPAEEVKEEEVPL